MRRMTTNVLRNLSAIWLVCLNEDLSVAPTGH
jgi:hypothetical protein